MHDAMMRGLGEPPALLMAEGKNKLQSAIDSPQWAALHADADLAEQTALLAIRIAQAHALLDNNKRLAQIVGFIFLWRNGRTLSAEQSSAFARWIIRALEHNATVTDMAAWLREVINQSP